MFRTSLILALAAAVLTGCGGAEASSISTEAAATPSLPCTLPYGTHVTLVSPAPGSSGVAAGNAPIVVVASRELPSAVTVIAIDHKGNAVTGAALEKDPVPPRVATPGYAHPIYYRSPGVALQPHRHYTIALDDLAQNGCAPYAPIRGNPRFST
jgi:hypothetical protein